MNINVYIIVVLPTSCKYQTTLPSMGVHDIVIVFS